MTTPPAGRANSAPDADFQWAYGSAAHAVQFYRDDAHLRDVVVQFLAAGLKVHQPVVIVATAAHRDMFEAELRRAGFDLDALQDGGELVFIDARQLLAAFMVNGMPDPGIFRSLVGDVLDSLGGRRRVVRAYGEMVDILWQEGNAPAALRLEQLWNALSKTYHFALLCGYAIENFTNPAHAESFEEVCGQHHHVVPMGYSR